MKSKVYFIPVKDASDIQGVNRKLSALLSACSFFDFVRAKDTVAVKMHFGEEGNTGYVAPGHLRVICDGIRGRGAVPYLSDANTLYRGRRINSADHLQLAYEHGFTKDATGADVIIPDDSQKTQAAEVPLSSGRIKVARVCRFYLDADALAVVSHFKGHILTGFGGALKNVGMGCATRQGKLAQHCDVAPVVHANSCKGCGECEIICPTKALKVVNKKITLDKKKCIGCASCVAACESMALFVDLGSGVKTQEKMADYTLAVLQGKEKKKGFINFAVKINKECDCWGADNPRIAPDVGILASCDPVSIDKASFDMVNKACGKDIFKANHPDQDGLRQLAYARDIGLGNLDYELVEVS